MAKFTCECGSTSFLLQKAYTGEQYIICSRCEAITPITQEEINAKFYYKLQKKG